jgi:hypothetical protein
MIVFIEKALNCCSVNCVSMCTGRMYQNWEIS